VATGWGWTGAQKACQRCHGIISRCYRRSLRVAMRTAPTARMKSRASASCRPETVVDVAQLTAVYESRSRGSGIARSNVTGKKGSQMPINSKYLFVASMDVDPDKEALFNEIYDAEHVPNLLKVPGVHVRASKESPSHWRSAAARKLSSTRARVTVPYMK